MDFRDKCFLASSGIYLFTTDWLTSGLASLLTLSSQTSCARVGWASFFMGWFPATVFLGLLLYPTVYWWWSSKYQVAPNVPGAPGCAQLGSSVTSDTPIASSVPSIDSPLDSPELDCEPGFDERQIILPPSHSHVFWGWEHAHWVVVAYMTRCVLAVTVATTVSVGYDGKSCTSWLSIPFGLWAAFETLNSILLFIWIATENTAVGL